MTLWTNQTMLTANYQLGYARNLYNTCATRRDKLSNNILARNFQRWKAWEFNIFFDENPQEIVGKKLRKFLMIFRRFSAEQSVEKTSRNRKKKWKKSWKLNSKLLLAEFQWQNVKKSRVKTKKIDKKLSLNDFWQNSNEKTSRNHGKEVRKSMETEF